MLGEPGYEGLQQFFAFLGGAEGGPGDNAAFRICADARQQEMAPVVGFPIRRFIARTNKLRVGMAELGTPPKLMDERMGHEDGSVRARYSHVTPEMRRRLLDGLTELWEASLNARRAMSPGSPVATLDVLLKVPR